MDKETRNKWKNNVLDIIFESLAESEVLLDCIVFKGARVLNKRLDSEDRQSLDIDANMLKDFVDKYESYAQMKTVLESSIREAVEDYLESQNPVMHELDNLKIIKKPHVDHALGWNAFEVSISIKDLSQPNVRGLPSLKIDIAAPEDLGVDSISDLVVGGNIVKAYSLERIAGEKLRAFLSSLPGYRKKVKKPGEVIRAKDIYDISRIFDQYPISETLFWDKAGVEFKRACASRFIDCKGIDSFEEGLDVTEATFNSDPTIPKSKTFNEAWRSVTTIAMYLAETKVIPFSCPLPKQ